MIQVLDGDLSSPQIAYPKGVIADPPDHLIVADFVLGDLYRCDLNTRNAQRISGGFGAPTGWPARPKGPSMWATGGMAGSTRSRPISNPRGCWTEKIKSPAGMYVTPDGGTLLVTDTKAGP